MAATMTYTERNLVNTYAVLFNNLSEVCKAALADRLLKIENKVITASNGFALSFGGWETNQTTDEIKAEIKNNRKFREKDIIFV
ncbi:MAG: hypothetical protein LBN95_05195 [Prevotellaceae bacterium]|jgi:hypothetical protein|nr:hypothetical protein [Prevotellaceae bacterium]